MHGHGSNPLTPRNKQSRVHNGTYALRDASGQNGLMKFSTAVRRLESVAEDLSTWRSFDDFTIIEAYVCGEMLDGPETLEIVSIAFVTDLPVADLSWRARPPVSWMRQCATS